MSVSIIHTSDIHLDTAKNSPSMSLRDETVRLNVRALASVIDASLGAGVDAIVHSGDVFSNGRPGPEAIRLFADTCAPALRAGIPIILTEGNHERLAHRRGQRTVTNILADVLGSYGEVHYADHTPRLIRTSSGIQVAALPWIDETDVDLEGLALEEQSAKLSQVALDRLGDVIDEADTSTPLVVSTHLGVNAVPEGSERDLTLLFREPMVSPDALASLPVSYVALGHIHTPIDIRPNVIYSGSPQRLTFTDEDDTKSCVLVTINDDGSLDSTRRIATDARAMATIDTRDVPDHLEPGALVRVILDHDMSDIPEAIVRLVDDAGARIASTLRHPSSKSDDDTTSTIVLPERITPTVALTSWIKEHHPDADIAALTTLAAKLSSCDC